MSGLPVLAALAGKEMRDILREKSLVVAFVIQLFLAAFSTLLLTGLSVLYDPESSERTPDGTLAFVGDGAFGTVLRRDSAFDVRFVERQDAFAMFRAGEVLAIVEETQRDGVQHVQLVLPDGELESTLLVTHLKGQLMAYEDQLRSARSERLSAEVYVVSKEPREERPQVYATLLPLLAITPVFLSGAVAGDALSQESRTRTLLLLRAAPVGSGWLVAGKLLVPVLLVPLQVALWMVLFALNGYPMRDFWLVLATVTWLGLLLTSAGLLVAAVVKNESATQAAYAVTVLSLGLASMMLPRDPLNLIALQAVGHTDRAAAHSLLWLASLAIAVTVAAVWFLRRALRRDTL
jgi:ABC-2 type transport system permease protein